MLNTKCKVHGIDHPDFLCPDRWPYAPEPCGCQRVSECCGVPPGLQPNAAVASNVGICPRCNDHVGFEKSDENTWKFLGTTPYGDDADGNFGVPLRAWECIECGQEVEVIG
ncbi:hypothetical protein LCGC14_1682570 [marine sediment metagenome]|uniref:Uncharacterized protein n=1 Tax=marine sediment metagenome TaxID=412755 RepID=A0A0F9IAK7_9ZZZZ